MGVGWGDFSVSTKIKSKSLLASLSKKGGIAPSLVKGGLGEDFAFIY